MRHNEICFKKFAKFGEKCFYQFMLYIRGHFMSFRGQTRSFGGPIT